MSSATSISRRRAKSKTAASLVRLAIGDEIDFGDPGVGKVTARDAERVFVESPVFTGWVAEDYLRGLLRINPDA